MPICYGVLALTPREIDKLTPREIIDMYHGWVIRRRRQQELLAEHVTLPIINQHVTKNSDLKTLEDIFGREDYIRRFGKSDKKPSQQELYKDFF